MTFDSLLDDRVPESDLTRRWVTVLPEEDRAVFEFIPAVPAALVFGDGLCGTSWRWSIGVGGVTCVSGGSSEAVVGVLGVVTIVGRSRTLVEGLCKLEVTDSLLSEALGDLPKLILFLLSLLNKA